MRMRITLLTALVAISGAMTLAPAAAAMPDEKFERWMREFVEARAELIARDNNQAGWVGVSNKDKVELSNRFMRRIDVSTLKPSQLCRLQQRRLLRYTWRGEDGRDFTDEALEIVEKRRHEKDAEGGAAAALYAALSWSYDLSHEQKTALLREALGHPALPEAIDRGAAHPLTSLLASSVPSDVLKAISEELAAYAEQLRGAPPAMAYNVYPLYEDIAFLGIDEDRLARIRRGLLELLDRAIASARSQDDVETLGELKWFEDARRRLELAPHVASLEGRPAPELTFIWDSAEGRDLRTLADLRDKIVILDFWATWCGPCWGAFPNMRALVERYEGLPVEVLGVTSLQGFTMNRETIKRIRAASAQEEFRQMQWFMSENDITWTVVFTEENVFNPEYGVYGIPSLAIVDPAGVVRHRGLYGGGDLKSKTEKIDAILKEFGLEPPTD